MKGKWAIIFIVLVGFALYAATLKGVAGNPAPSEFKGNLDRPSMPLELSPERGRFANVLALGEFGTYDLGQELADAVYPDVGYHEGRFYSFFAPGLVYLSLPFYLLGRIFNLSLVFTYAFVSLISVLSLFFLYKVARNIFSLPAWAAVLSVLIYAFATTSWSYAGTLYQHHLTVFFLLSAFYAVWKYRRQNNFLLALWVWLAFGLAVSVDYPNAVLFLPVLAYFLFSALDVQKQGPRLRVSLRQSFVLGAAVLLAIAGLNAYHNQANFGRWSRLSGELPDYVNIKEQNLLNRPESEEAIRQISQQKGLSGFFEEYNIPYSFYILTVSPERGLLFYSPVLLLGVLGAWKLRRVVNLETGVLLGMVVANLLLYSSWGDPWGGWAYGPRYLIPSMAALSLLAALWVSKASRPALSRILLIVLFAYSSFIALLGAVTSNAVPPRMEAINLPLKYYNYLYNWYLLRQGKSGSFVYNTYFPQLDLYWYALAVFSLLMAVFFAVLFIAPRLERQKQ